MQGSNFPETVVSVVVSHRHGENRSVHVTSAGAWSELAKYAREWWTEVTDDLGLPSPPQDNEEVVKAYFDAHDSEDYTLEVVPLQRDTDVAS